MQAVHPIHTLRHVRELPRAFHVVYLGTKIRIYIYTSISIPFVTVWTRAKTSITFRLMSNGETGTPISRVPVRPNLQMLSLAYIHPPPLFYRRTTDDSPSPLAHVIRQR